MPSIQDYVVAVVRFAEQPGGGLQLLDAFGTAFFVDDVGTFLTARSVLEDALAARPSGLLVRTLDGRASPSLVPIVEHEFAPAPFDVALGRASLTTRRAFDLARVDAAPLLWESVASFGCVGLERVRPDRPAAPIYHALTGNVMREVPALADERAACFEISFAVSSVLRGAPLFVHERPRSRLLGLCSGNRSVDELRYPGGTEAGPESARFGVAQDLRALATWRPRCAPGSSLRDLFAPS